MKKNTFRKVTAILFIVLTSFQLSFAQTSSSLWELTADGNPTVVGSIIANSIGLGVGVSNPIYTTTNGITTSSWSNDATNIVATEYYEFSVTPVNNTNFLISQIDFEHSVSNGNWNVALYFSLDDFATSFPIGTLFSSNSLTPIQRTNSVAISVSNATFKVRIYAWESDGKNRKFNIRNFQLSGTTCALPIITTQPVSVELCSGQEAIFSINSSNTSSFQWRKNGIDIPDATSSTLTIGATATSDSGVYDVELLSFDTCSLLSAPAILTVNQSTAVALTPLNAELCLGDTVPLVAQLSATEPITFLIGNGLSQNNRTGTSNSIFPSPYAAHYENVKQHYLILASELTAMGFQTNSEITSITFEVISLGNSGIHNNFTISIGTTSQNSLSYWENGLELVYGSVNYQPISGSNSHSFNQAFVWDGTSNIVIQICHSNDLTASGNFKTANAIINYTTTSFISSLVYRTDNTEACATNSITYSESQRPNILVSGNVKPVITWSPTIDLFLNSSATIPYDGSATELVYSKPSANRNYTILSNSGGSCIASQSVSISVENQTNWLGITNAWEENSNWSCGYVPTIDHKVTIDTTNNQPIITTHAFSKSLVVLNNAVLTLASNSSYTIADAISLEGTLVQENNANLIQQNNSLNSGTGKIIVSRDSPPLMRLDYMLWSAPVSGQLLQSFSPETLSNRFYSYASSSNLYVPISNPMLTNFEKGSSYLIRMPNTHPTVPTIWNGQFEGFPNNGFIPISVTPSTYNALGNPYPSTIDADQFIIANNLSEALYFWRKTNNPAASSYAIYTLAGGIGTSNSGDPLGLIPNGILQVGQGFIVKSTSSSLFFNNQMRIINSNNQILKTSQNEKSRIWLNLSNTNNFICQTMLAYMPGATAGIDAAIDGKYFNDSQSALTSIIDNQEFAIQATGLPFETSDEFTLGFKTAITGNFSIGIDHVDGIFSTNQPIYLKDNLLNTIHNLKLSDYSFSSNNGVYNSRFQLVFQNVLSNISATSTSEVVVFAKNNKVYISTGSLPISEVKITDIMGRIVYRDIKNTSLSVEIHLNCASQLLLVDVLLNNGARVTKKISN